MQMQPPERNRIKIMFPEETLTEQHHKDACDIHLIMRQAEKTGMISHLNQHQGQYMDLASRPEFLEAQQIIATAKSVFETVPAKIREKFDNDPAQFVDYLQNEENRAGMLEMGFTDDHLPPLPDPLPEAVTPPEGTTEPDKPKTK